MERVQALNIDVLTGAVNPMPKVKDAGDDQLHVSFGMFSHFDDVKTRDAQRPIFEMAEYVTIMVPGDQNTIIHRPVRSIDMERFPRQYEAFKAGKEQQTGYPLSEWAGVTRAQADELAYFKIMTVEALAGVSDSVKQKFMGLGNLSEKAKIWLEQQKGEEPALRLQAEVIRRDEQISGLTAQLEQLQAAVAEMQKSKRGRKAQTEDDAEAA